MKKTLFCLLLVCLSFQLFAQVDETFRPVVTSTADITAIAGQADGKIIVAGDIVAFGETPCKRIVRLNADGTIDPSFSAPDLPRESIIRTLIIEPSGKIMVGGVFGDSRPAFRLNSNGSVDATFTLAEDVKTIFKIVRFDDGRYLVYHDRVSGRGPLTIVKQDGTVDASFNIGTGPNGYGLNYSDVAVQSDGKVILAGPFTQFNGTPINNRIVRLNANGSIDNSFVVGSGPNNLISTVTPLSNGKLMIFGLFTTFNNITYKYAVRLNSNGSVDQTFLPLPAALDALANGVSAAHVLSDGIILAGLEFSGNQVFYKFLKINLDGSFASAFPVRTAPYSDRQGEVRNPIFTNAAAAIVLAGDFTAIDDVKRSGIAIFSNGGSLDGSFNPPLRSKGEIRDVKMQADGKYVVAGYFDFVGSVSSKNIARLSADGTVEASFGANVAKGPNLDANVLALDADGKIIVGGNFYEYNGQSTGGLVRLNADGTRDVAFDPKIYSASVGSGVYDIKMLPSGKIAVGGYFYGVNNTTCRNFVILESNGTIPLGFNTQALATEQVVHAIAVQGLDKLLIGGERWPNIGGGFFYQVNLEGQLLNNFPNVNLSNTRVNAIELLPNGKIVMGGSLSTAFSSTTPVPLFQISADGAQVDNLSVKVYDGAIEHIQVLSNDAVILAGSFKKVNETAVTGFARVDLNGIVKSAKWNFGGPIYAVRPLNAESTRLLLAGSFTSIGSLPMFGIAKFDLNAPAPPSNLTFATDDAYGKVALTWVDNSDENIFEIFRSSGGDFQFLQSVNANTTSFTDLTATPLSGYQYKVRAVADANSNFSNTVLVSTSAWVAPAIPSNFAFGELGQPYNEVHLTWANAATNAIHFQLERSIDGSAFQQVAELPSSQTSYTDAFEFNSDRRYRLRAVNVFGASAYTEILQVPLITDVSGESASVAVYPNPVANTLTVRSGHPIKAHLMTLDGHVVAIGESRDGLLHFELSQMPNGIYLLKLNEGLRAGNQVIKVVKN